MDFTYFESGNIAVLLLAFIGGLALSYILKARGISGCFTYIIAITIFIVIVSGLVKGYSLLIENVTFHLQQYIFYNSTGVIGFVLGFVFGKVFNRK